MYAISLGKQEDIGSGRQTDLRLSNACYIKDNPKSRLQNERTNCTGTIKEVKKIVTKNLHANMMIQPDIN